MMNALHLLWIAPLCFGFGFTMAAVLAAGREADQ